MDRGKLNNLSSLPRTQEDRKRELVQTRCSLVSTFTWWHMCPQIWTHTHSQTTKKIKFASFWITWVLEPLIGVVWDWRSLRYIYRTSGIRWSQHSDGRKDTANQNKSVCSVYIWAKTWNCYIQIIKEAGLLWRAEQIGIANLSRISLYMGSSLQAVNIQKEKDALDIFVHSSTSTLGPESSFAVPLSLSHGRICHSNESEALGSSAHVKEHSQNFICLLQKMQLRI